MQRWNHRRDSYRPQGEPIDTSRYGVEEIDELVAKQFVLDHHYSASYPAARFRVGLHRVRSGGGTELVGVAVFSQPMQSAVVPKYLPGARDGVELGRFVLLDDVPANGETWMLARAFRLLREAMPEVDGVVSYSDPLPRRTIDGEVVLPGHIGTIYQAHNGRYLGRSSKETLTLAPDGSVVSRRSLSKIRNGERGEGYAYRKLVELGAPTRRTGEDGRAYVQRALAEGPFRRVRHPGNHVYAWPFQRRVGRVMPATQSYPKPSAQLALLAA